TKALWGQKVRSMSPMQQWWYKVLQDGKLLGSHTGRRDRMSKADLHAGYLTAVTARGRGHRDRLETFGKNRKALCPPGLRDARPHAVGRRERYWAMPPLSSCREHFERLVQRVGRIVWETPA